MIFSAKHNRTQLNRQEALDDWMTTHEVTFVAMGKVLGEITGAAVSKMLRQKRMPVKQHQALTQAYPDLPVEFLPEPRNVRRGPKPGYQRTLSASA